MTKKRGNSKKIDLLTSHGWKKISLTPNKSRRRKLMALIGVEVVILLFVILLIPVTYSRYQSKSNSNANIKVAPWKYTINTSSDKEITVDLADTITENNYSMEKVIPGTKGAIELDLDFTGSKVAVDYVVSLNTSEVNLPSNLKLYTNSSRTEEFHGFEGSVLLDSQKVTRTIYWEWKYTTEDETSMWANKDIQLGLTIGLEQKIG